MEQNNRPLKSLKENIDITNEELERNQHLRLSVETNEAGNVIIFTRQNDKMHIHQYNSISRKRHLIDLYRNKPTSSFTRP